MTPYTTMSRSLRSCLTRPCIAGTVHYAQVLTRPSFWEIFPVETRVPKSRFPAFVRVGPRGGYYGGRQPLRRVRQECGPRPHSTTRFYLLCKSAPCWSHNSCACPVMNLLFTDTTYIVSSSGQSDIISRLFSISLALLVLFCCVGDIDSDNGDWS